MCFTKYFLVLASALLTSYQVFSQNIWDGYEHLFKPVKHTVAYQTLDVITIDGKANENSWQNAEWSEYFVDIKKGTLADSANFTRYKVLWDKSFLYIFAKLREPHIWTYNVNSAETISNENDFEIFLDPDKDTHNYFEFELNAQNQLSDRLMPVPGRNGGKPVWEWACKGFKSAVSIYGTLNNPSDIDSMWTVEIAIPFKALTQTDRYIIPKNGDYWKVNFARVEWATEIKGGMYYKKDKSSKGKQNWVWSPQYAGNMHYPEQWGMITFSTNKVGSTTIIKRTPVEEKFGNYLWFLYYKQLEYRKKHLQYAQKLSDLGLSQVWKTKNGEAFLYDLDIIGHTFTITLKTKRGLKLSINQDGLFQVVEK